MREVVVCSPVRTPVGRFGGALRDVGAAELAATVIRALVGRTGIDPAEVDDVILGQCYPNGEAPAIGRVAALDAGLPVEVGGVQVDRRCGSGLQAVVNGVMQVATGASDVVIAGGAESMSGVEYYANGLRWERPGAEIKLTDRLARARITAGGDDYPVPGGMLETAENVRELYDIGRDEQDELALRSHQRAVAAQEEGRFADEIVPVEVRDRKGVQVVDRDEHPRADSTLERLGGLRPVLGVDGATVTAGNSSGQNDGAAVCLVTTRENADRLGLAAQARLVSWAVAGVAPHLMGLGPVPATREVLDRAGLTLSDMDLIELNEAFAAQVLGCTREWKFGDADFDRRAAGSRTPPEPYRTGRPDQAAAVRRGAGHRGEPGLPCRGPARRGPTSHRQPPVRRVRSGLHARGRAAGHGRRADQTALQGPVRGDRTGRDRRRAGAPPRCGLHGRRRPVPVPRGTRRPAHPVVR